jgi:hypothetical protein
MSGDSTDGSLPRAPSEHAIKAPRCTFSLEFGIPVEMSPEFQKFKRDHSNRWEEIEIVLDLLRRICEEKGLKEEFVDGGIIADVSKLDPDEVSREKIMRCFVDRSVRTAPRAAKLGFGFIGPDAEDKAAILIQSVWRGYRARWLVRWLKRSDIARLVVQRWAKRVLTHRRFREQMRQDEKRREAQYEQSQFLPAPKPEQPQYLLQVVECTSGAQIGRLWALRNPNVRLVIYSRNALPIKADRVICLGAQVKLPEALPIEDVLAADGKSLRKIKDLAMPSPIMWHGQGISKAGVEIATRLGALPLVPAPGRVRSLETRLAHRRILAAAKLPLFECGDEVFDKLRLCRSIAELAIKYLSIREWVIRANSGSTGWVGTDDFVVLEKVRKSVDILTAEDLADENFRESLRESIVTDLPLILNVVGEESVVDFLNEVWISGGLIEAGPVAPRTSPGVAVFVSPAGQARMIGTWERLFIAGQEQFASIHPAFLSHNLENLKAASMLIAADCATKRYVGTNVMHFWESDRALTKRRGKFITESHLTPDELFIADFERVLPHYLVEHVLNRPFDENSMSFGPSVYVYVQDKLQLPGRKSVADLKEGLIEAGVAMDSRVNIFPEFTGREEICLVVREATPERLVNLVYHIMTAFADAIFGRDVSPAHPIYAYCHALEFLKSQTEDKAKIQTTVLTGKKMKETRKRDRQRVFRFSNAVNAADLPDM